MRKTYVRALATMDIATIKDQINTGSNVNVDYSGYHAFELLLSRRDKQSKEVLDTVLSHPLWNPNYQMIDGLSPLERAILNNREDVALKIMRHPNYKKEKTPNLIRISRSSASVKFRKFLEKEMQNQR